MVDGKHATYFATSGHNHDSVYLKAITLKGDVTGSLKPNTTESTLTLASSGVTAGSYGPSANATPNHGATFSVPYITVDAKGRVTAAATHTITLP